MSPFIGKVYTTSCVLKTQHRGEPQTGKNLGETKIMHAYVLHYRIPPPFDLALLPSRSKATCMSMVWLPARNAPLWQMTSPP